MDRIIKKIFSIILLVAITVIYSSSTQAAENDIIILHTNDMHCGVNENLGLSRIAWYKQELLQETPNVVLVDAGDAIQGAPLGKLSDGEAIVKIMNEVGYDFCIPGNHEFDYGMERFKELAKLQKCGYYSANIIDKRNNVPLLPAYRIIDFEGTKVAFIGVTTPETLRSSTPTYFQDSNGEYVYSFYEDQKGDKLYLRLQQTVDEVRSIGAEYVFIVAHIGVNGVPEKWSSIELAQRIIGIDGIIDGHSHEKINRIVVNRNGDDVLVIQAGSKLKQIGQITITSDGQIKSKLVSKIEGEEEKVKSFISQEIEKYRPILEQPVGEALVKLHSTDPDSGERIVRKSECSLGNFVTDAFRAVLECDVAIANGGGIRQEIETGVITYNDLIEAFPFGNMCSVIEVSGQQLLDALEVGVKNYPEEHGGFLHVSGLSYSFDPKITSSVILNERGEFIKVAGDYRVREVLVGDKPLDVNKRYTIGSIDYILRSGGNSMTMFKGAYVVKDAVITDYDAILEYLQNHLDARIGEQYSNPYGNGRITVIE